MPRSKSKPKRIVVPRTLDWQRTFPECEYLMDAGGCDSDVRVTERFVCALGEEKGQSSIPYDIFSEIIHVEWDDDGTNYYAWNVVSNTEYGDTFKRGGLSDTFDDAREQCEGMIRYDAKKLNESYRANVK